MPRVVPDQREKFENDDIFRRLSRETEVRYAGFRDRPIEERRLLFQDEIREGHATIGFVSGGMTIYLQFLSNSWSERPEDRRATQEFVDFNLEPGKVHLKSQFIMNGVCVVWKGWISLQRLDGMGRLEFDQDRAMVEDGILRDQIEQYNQRLRVFEERHQQHQRELQRQVQSESEPSTSYARMRTSPATSTNVSSVSVKRKTPPESTSVSSASQKTPSPNVSSASQKTPSPNVSPASHESPSPSVSSVSSRRNIPPETSSPNVSSASADSHQGAQDPHS